MFQLFFKYLILYKRASIPGIGVFFIERKPAKLDFSNRVFVGPDFQVSFKPHAELADNKFYTFISRAQKIDVTDAASQFGYFANKLKNNLAEKRSVQLPGLGVLEEDQDGRILFNATVDLNSYFPTVAADRVIRKNTEHHVLVGDKSRTNREMKEVSADYEQEVSHSKDYWWIFAIALGIIGIATIVYYYLHNGSLR